MAFPFRHKVLLLVFAYACVAGIFVCALMAPWNQPEEDLAHAPNLRDPCSWGIFLHSRHIGKDDFFKKRCAPHDAFVSAEKTAALPELRCALPIQVCIDCSAHSVPLQSTIPSTARWSGEQSSRSHTT